jgi:hypothetical protein
VPKKRADMTEGPPPSFTPSTETEIRNAIAKLNALKLAGCSIEEVETYLKVIFTGYRTVAPIFDPGLLLYRARKMSYLPKLASEIGAPPANKVLLDQRCNRAGQSFFYCSSAVNAPFFEVHTRIGDQLVLSKWRTTAKMTVNQIGYTRSNFARLKSSRDCPVWSPKSPDPAMTSNSSIVDEFFSSYFSVDVKDGEEHLYKATIAMTERLIPIPTIPTGFPFDGLMYPTISMMANCDNFALRPAFVETNVRLVHAEYVKVTKIQGVQMTFDRLDFANSISAEGALEWKAGPANGPYSRANPAKSRWTSAESRSAMTSKGNSFRLSKGQPTLKVQPGGMLKRKKDRSSR